MLPWTTAQSFFRHCKSILLLDTAFVFTPIQLTCTCAMYAHTPCIPFYTDTRKSVSLFDLRLYCLGIVNHLRMHACGVGGCECVT